jgi:hypothetical protein
VTAARASVRDGLALAGVALVPMLLAASRDLDWYDGPELALAAVNLGEAHPPAEPLHTLVGWLLSRVFPAYFGVALASVIPACLCAVPATVLADAIVAPGEGRRARLLRALPIVAALWCAPVFETSTRVEVYALATLAALAALALAAHGRALLAGVALGLTACANPVFAITAALGVAVMSFAKEPLRALPRTFVGGLVGLAPYAYLPFAARDVSRFVWGEPSSARAFFAVLRASDFAANVSVRSEHVATSAQALTDMLVPAGAAVLVAALGWALAWRASRTLALAGPTVALAQAATLLANAAFAYNPDLHGYLMPTTLVAGVGLAAAVSRARERGAKAVWLCALLPLAALVTDLPWIGARLDGAHAARTMARELMTEAPRDAVVLLESDHLVFTSLYLQEVEGERPDLVLVNTGFVNSSWYWRHLARRHPGLRVVLEPGLGRELRLVRFLDANPARPVVAETGGLLARARRPVCEGTFLTYASRECAAVDVRRRVATLARAAQDIDGDWIGERVVAIQASNLAREARIRGAPGRAARTLAAIDPGLAGYAELIPPGPDDPRRSRPTVPRPPHEALVSPAWVRYELGRTLAEEGQERGVELIRRAADEGVEAAAQDLARVR